MLNEQVRYIMTKNVVTVSPNETLENITKLMNKRKLQQIPVVENDQFKGLVTSFDLWRVGDFKNIKVEDIMIRKVIKITPIDKVGTAAELFMDKRFKALPVVNLRNELKGLVTAFDVIKQVMQKEYKPKHMLYPEVFEQD